MELSKKIASNAPHEELFDKDGNELEGPYKKITAKHPCVTLYNNKRQRLPGKYANIISDIPNEEVFDKNGNKLDGIFLKQNEDETPYVEGYDASGKKIRWYI
jgi:hypothetical protein